MGEGGFLSVLVQRYILTYPQNRNIHKIIKIPYEKHLFTDFLKIGRYCFMIDHSLSFSFQQPLSSLFFNWCSDLLFHKAQKQPYGNSSHFLSLDLYTGLDLSSCSFPVTADNHHLGLVQHCRLDVLENRRFSSPIPVPRSLR